MYLCNQWSSILAKVYIIGYCICCAPCPFRILLNQVELIGVIVASQVHKLSSSQALKFANYQVLISSSQALIASSQVCKRSSSHLSSSHLKLASSHRKLSSLQVLKFASSQVRFLQFASSQVPFLKFALLKFASSQARKFACRICLGVLFVYCVVAGIWHRAHVLALALCF